MFSKLMKKTIAVAAIAAMTSVMAAVATPWWSIDFDSYTDGAKVSASTETQGTWTQQEDDLSVVTSQSLSLNTQGEDLLWTPNAPAESYDSVILDADVKFVASDVEPTTDNSMQTAIYLKATDDGDVLCVYQDTEDGAAWEAKDAFTIADGDTKHVTITIDYSDETPMVTLTIGDTSVEYPVANVADKVSSVAFRGTGVVDNFTAQTSVNATYVAEVNGTGFETYAAALAYVAANGGTLTITGDSAEELSFGTFTFTQNATIDLGGKEITAAFVVDGGAQFSIDNGTVTAPEGKDVIKIVDGMATVGADAILYASTDCCVYLNDKNADSQLALDVYGKLYVTNDTGYAAIYGNGNNVAESTINIFDDAVVSHDYDLAIYHAQVGTLTIEAATIVGTTAIEMRAGELVVNEGAFIEGTAEFSATPNGNGSTVLGAAIALSQHTTEQPTSVTVTGGTLKGARAFYQDNLASGTSTSVSATIAAGTTLDGAVEVAEEGFMMPQAADGSYTLTVSLASVDGQKFETYAEAFAYVVANGGDLVITGASDETLGVYNITKDATIDLGGQSITTAFVVDGGAQFEIDNGTVTALAKNDVIFIKDGMATVKADATLVASTDCAVFMKGDVANSTQALDVYGTLVGAAGYGTIQGSGSTKSTNPTVIKIYDGATVTNAADLAIYHPQNGTLTIGAATITGTTGIEMRAGNLVVNGATITATGTEFAMTPNGNGSTVLGAAVALSQHSTSLPTSVTVNSGTLTGDVAFYAAGDAEDISATIGKDVVLADGADIVVAEGFVMPEAADGSYTLATANFIVAGMPYDTFAAAYDAAAEGATIEVYTDFAASEIITISKSITIDGNDHTLTSTAGRAINIDGADGATIQNLTIVANGERGINIINGATNVTITDVDVTAKNYAVNLAASAGGAVVTITDSTLTGLNAFNAGAANAEVTIAGSEIYCNDNSPSEYYGAISLNQDAAGTQVVVTGSQFYIKENSDSVVAVNGASGKGATITIDGSTEAVENMVAAIDEANGYSNLFTTLAGAFAKADAGETVKLIANATEDVTIAATATLDLNGFAVAGTFTITDAAAKLNAAQGLNVVTNVEGYEVVFADGCYSVQEKVVEVEFAPVKTTSIVIEGNTAKLTIGGEYTEVKVYFKATLDAEFDEIPADFAEGVATVPATTATGFFTVHAR